MNELLFALVAGLGFAASGLLGVLGICVWNTLRVLAVAVAAGLLLGIVIADLVPDALERAGRGDAAFGFVAGFLVLFLIEVVTRAHLHHHDPHDGHDHSHDHLAAHHTLLPFVCGLALHNLADGLAIGASGEFSANVAGGVTAGILVHQLPVGISFAAVLGAMTLTRAQIVRWSVLLGLAIPLGAAVIALSPNQSSHSLGWLLAAAAGALTYVATGHLLPEAQAEERKYLVAVAFAATLGATVWWFTQVSAG